MFVAHDELSSVSITVNIKLRQLRIKMNIQSRCPRFTTCAQTNEFDREVTSSISTDLYCKQWWIQGVCEINFDSSILDYIVAVVDLTCS